MLKSDEVHIWRDADGVCHLEWGTSAPDTQVAVEALEEGAGEPDYHSTDERRARYNGLPADRTHHFRLKDQHGNEVVAKERKLGMQGTPNFRDYGGYRTTDDREVKWGHLFRSGQLSRLTERDLALLAHLGLDFVCDFRREEEQTGDPSRLPEERAPRIVSVPIIPGSNAAFFEQAGDGMGAEVMFSFMVDINRDFALVQTEAYRRMFCEILETEGARFLVHCAAGKDRTGFAAAIVLLALGVPRETVMHDYLMTGRYFNPEREFERIREKYGMAELAEDAIRPMLEVHEDYLSAALAAIDERYPSIEDYLAEELGVGEAEKAELRGRYLR